jgi:hypothetical protein
MPPVKSKQPVKGKRGPKEERLKFDMDWKDAIKKAFLKKKPKAGWPD